MTKRLKNFFLDLIFPRKCIGCRQSDTWLCTQCFSLIKTNKTQHCYKCGKASLHGATCKQHLKRSPTKTLDGLLVGAHYNGNPILKKAIKTLKYQKRTEDIANKLSLLLEKNLSSFLKASSQSCSLQAVPLHKSRLKQRGFNQSELLTPEIAEQTIAEQILLRTKNTAAQAQTTSRKERQQNLNNAFSIDGSVHPNTNYILIDDVCTTGTTLEECCKVLKQAGAKQVWGLVLAQNR